MDPTWSHQRQPHRQGDTSARSNQSFATSNNGNHGTINPDYRQAQSYNPSSSGTSAANRPPGQIHDAYRRAETNNATAARDVYSARSDQGATLTAASQTPVETQTTTTNNSARPAPKRSRAKKQAAPVPDAAGTAAQTSSAATGMTESAQPGRPLPFDTKPLYNRIEQLTKTHGDLISYLHGELDRRRDWEEMMVKEMHQRHQVLLTLITSLVPVTNANMGSAAAASRSLLAPDLSTTIGRAGLPGMPSVFNMGSLQDNDFGAGGGFDDDNDYGNESAVINPSQSSHYIHQTGNETATGPAGLKRAHDGDGPHFSDVHKDAGVEVDERGIIYMAGGRRAGIVPTKIASLVRKTLYASQGVPVGRLQLPLHVAGMYPANGDEHWSFGNLRFDWNSTTRKSSHNADMKQIVIEHIVSHRYAYPEIPESEFTAERLDTTYEQSFSSWKAKFLGKRPSGPNKKPRKSMGLREVQKLLEVVGTGRHEAEHNESQTPSVGGDGDRMVE